VHANNSKKFFLPDILFFWGGHLIRTTVNKHEQTTMPFFR